MPSRIPRAYLITFTCYGTWLPGSAKGSVDRTHNVPGTPFLPPDEPRKELNRRFMKGERVRLTPSQRRTVDRAIRQHCEYRGWELHAANVRTNHVHVVVGVGDVAPERLLIEFKSYATRALVAAAEFQRGTSIWTRHGSTIYLWDAKAIHDASRYVVERQ